MRSLVSRLQILRSDRRAVTALEYGIIASALAFVLIAAFGSLSTPISQIFSNVGKSI
jgi:Flp pilus assembly pilin Flp